MPCWETSKTGDFTRFLFTVAARLHLGREEKKEEEEELGFRERERENTISEKSVMWAISGQ